MSYIVCKLTVISFLSADGVVVMMSQSGNADMGRQMPQRQGIPTNLNNLETHPLFLRIHQ